MAAEIRTNEFALRRWVGGSTQFDAIVERLFDAPDTGIRAWLRTTAGVVAFLIALQAVTGILLAFSYVPSADSAFTTVAFIEQATNGGTWIRSLHYHSSVMLPIALVAHIAQMIVRGSFRSNRTAWTFAIVILGLVLAAGATGYALPWDARSLNGVNIAVTLAGNAPLVGKYLGNWLRNGETISTMTLSRFYGLHVLIVPTLIAFAVCLRLFVFGTGRGGSGVYLTGRGWRRDQTVRNAVVIAIVFAALAWFSSAYPAPLAVPGTDAATFLPRPGPQFLWLFEMQKYTDGTFAAVLAFGAPAVVFGLLAALPVVLKAKISAVIATSVVFVGAIVVVGSLTAAAYLQDTVDPKISAQLAKQEKDEEAFRAAQFKPKVVRLGKEPEKESPKSDPVVNSAVPVAVPATYVSSCAKCHGPNGEGKGAYPELHGLTTREDERRSDEDLLGIINDPGSFGLSAKMPSYEHKLNDEQKQEIINWLKSLN